MKERQKLPLGILFQISKANSILKKHKSLFYDVKMDFKFVKMDFKFVKFDFGFKVRSPEKLTNQN